MELQRKIRALANKVNPSNVKNPEPETSSHSNQGLATLIVMITVLTIIILFCCFAAPGVRDLCKRYIFRTCVIDDPDADNIYTRSLECGRGVDFQIKREKSRRTSRY